MIKQIHIVGCCLDGDAEEERKREMTRSNYAAQLDGLGYQPDGNPKPREDEKEDDLVLADEIVDMVNKIAYEGNTLTKEEVDVIKALADGYINFRTMLLDAIKIIKFKATESEECI